MEQIDFSVIIVSYNNTEKQIINTIESCTKQKKVRYEILIADDGSDMNHYESINRYMSLIKFSNYKLVNHQNNLGTVKNIQYALKYVSGKYIKILGAGDELSDDLVLHDVLKYFNQTKESVIFTKMINKIKHKEDFIYKKCKLPITIKKYNNKSFNYRKDILVYSNFISGASLYFERNTLDILISEISDHVIYIEDAMQFLCIVHNINISLYNRVSIIYEYGTGISTNKENSFHKKLEEDMNSIMNYILNHYSNIDVVKEKKRFDNHNKIKKAIYNPSYILRRIEVTLYRNSLNTYCKKGEKNGEY